jgi:SEC-C motif-containing protein
MVTRKRTDPKDACCPCGSGAPLAACCGRLLSGQARPDTAEQLMRSRYTAYVVGDEAYLRRTWHGDTCPAAILSEDRPDWLGLKILKVRAGGAADTEGTVEFIARYKRNGRAFRLHEVSRFGRDNGRWVYIDGDAEGRG